MRSAFVVVPITLAVVAAFPLAAEVPDTGTLSGHILDPAGELLPGVTVILDGPRGTRARTAGADGSYRFANLVPDDYEVSVSLDGFSPVTAKARVGAGQRVRLDVRLRLATAESVEVVADAGGGSGEPGSESAIPADMAEDLVFLGRNFQTTFIAFPGAVQEAASLVLGSQRPSVDGSQWQEINGFVDGVDTSHTRAGGTTRIFLPTAVMSEIRFHGSGRGARYGRSVGGNFNAVVKSGTNELHGELAFIPRSERWRAQSRTSPLPRDDSIQGNYELTLGGPIASDRFWFFAAAAENSSNEIDALADGTVVDNSLRRESTVVKLSAALADDQLASLTWIDAPVEKTGWDAASADRFTPAEFDLGGELVKAAWYASIGRDSHVEVRAAHQESRIGTEALRLREVDPAASPDSPLGNQSLYRDLATGLKHNALYLASGRGFEDLPRDQLSASFSRLFDRHELEVGVDFQSFAWRSFNQPPPLYRGQGYDEGLPGGFVVPLVKRVYEPQAKPSESSSRVMSVYVQDRFRRGPHWTLQAGLRLDVQRHDNDVGEEVIRSTDPAPRLAAIYDPSGDGRLLWEATLGRYVQVIPLNVVGEHLARLPNGVNSWTDFGWNPASGLYDRLLVFVPPPEPSQVQPFDPYYKDEASLALSWRPRRRWTAGARAIWWSLEDLYWVSEQFDDRGDPFLAIRNDARAERRYRALALTLDGRTSSGLAVSANYTLSRLDGNMFPAGTIDEDTLFEGEGGIEPRTGRSDATSVNRSGRGSYDRTHNLNLSVVREWTVGRQTWSLGALASYRSGEPWTPLAPVNLVSPQSGQSIRSITFLEPRGSRRLPATFGLNLGAAWGRAITERVAARLEIEIANATDEQRQILVNPLDGQAPVGRFSYQRPRELRLVASLEF